MLGSQIKLQFIVMLNVINHSFINTNKQTDMFDTAYFAFGQPMKTSLIAEFARQNNYQHLINPTLQTLQNKPTQHQIIQGQLTLFTSLQPLRPQLHAIFIGTKFTEEEIQIRRDYRKIGKCIEVRLLSYELFRKAMYPNLIFFYGPREEQNINCAHLLASQISYCRVPLPASANNLIKSLKKTFNYTISGLFTSESELKVLQEYFNIKVIHLQYNRIDLPQQSSYFDKQYQLMSYLKHKPYYHNIDGLHNDPKIIDLVSETLSPNLVYCQIDQAQKRKYLDQYVYNNQDNTLILSTFEIQSINKRKNIQLADTPLQRVNLLNQILYKDFNVKTALILDFPFLIHEILHFESANRRFSTFIDLTNPQNTHYFKEFTTPMYFLQNQTRLVPNIQKPLENYLNATVNYWLINGLAGSGKSTVAKHLSTQFGFKLIEYEPYLSAIKQKLITPQDGDQLPVKKIFAHFKQLLTKNINDTYVIDGLPFENKDLQQWISVVGIPSVINLEVSENQSIKRTRKKNQADVNAQITEEDTAKAKESLAKSQAWLQKIRTLCPIAEIHQVNFNSPLILSQKVINKIFKKNVYLVQRHNSLAFQNVALKYNLAFINLHMIPLRETVNMVRKIQNKNLILCYYHQQEQKLVSEDLFWIEKNIGTIRYLGVCEPEELKVHEEKLELQRPKAPQKPKVQGAQGEQKVAQPVQQEKGEKKDVFDIYAYEWTKAVNPKNLSQWFIKSKKSVTKVNSGSEKQVFENWPKIISSLSTSQQQAVYHTFK